mmetsp:Transcript_22889/g.65997  ORF Transcript_22889/g.65997 Transcript_22889/m.65997 type:complete len:203 (+) Transcript_22889:1147-1755(+)
MEVPRLRVRPRSVRASAPLTCSLGPSMAIAPWHSKEVTCPPRPGEGDCGDCDNCGACSDCGDSDDCGDCGDCPCEAAVAVSPDGVASLAPALRSEPRFGERWTAGDAGSARGVRAIARKSSWNCTTQLASPSPTTLRSLLLAPAAAGGLSAAIGLLLPPPATVAVHSGEPALRALVLDDAVVPSWSWSWTGPGWTALALVLD